MHHIKYTTLCSSLSVHLPRCFFYVMAVLRRIPDTVLTCLSVLMDALLFSVSCDYVQCVLRHPSGFFLSCYMSAVLRHFFTPTFIDHSHTVEVFRVPRRRAAVSDDLPDAIVCRLLRYLYSHGVSNARIGSPTRRASSVSTLFE